MKYHFVYVILCFPKKSEKFIAREVKAMAEYLGPILVYSLKKGEYRFSPDPNIEIVYLEDLSFWSAVAAHLYLFKNSPKRYFRALFKYIIIPWIKVYSPKNDRAKIKRTLKKTRRYLKAVYIAADIKRKDIAHIHAHYAHRPSQTSKRISAFTGIPFSFTAHAKDLFLSNRSKVIGLVKKASFVLTCTHDGESHLKNICPKKYHYKIQCIYHGLPLDMFAPPIEKVSNDIPIILSAGRFIDKKGFDIFLQALRILKDRKLNFHCILAGEGTLFPDLKYLAEKLNLCKEIEFPGFTSEEDLALLYQRATVFVLACRESVDGNKDGIPNVILEAMATNVPVISTRVGGIPEVITNGKNGLLVEPEQPIKLAGAIESLLKNQHLRQLIGKAGRSSVCREFDINKNSKILLCHFLNNSERLKNLYTGYGYDGADEKRILKSEKAGAEY